MKKKTTLRCRLVLSFSKIANTFTAHPQCLPYWSTLDGWMQCTCSRMFHYYFSASSATIYCHRFLSSSFSDVSHLFASAHPKLHVKNDFLRFVWLCVSYRGPTVRFKIDPHWILCHTKSKIASFSYYIWRNEGFLEACGTFIEHLCAIFPIFSIFFFSFRSSQMIIVKLAFWLFE